MAIDPVEHDKPLGDRYFEPQNGISYRGGT
jgi:hypothetical protein